LLPRGMTASFLCPGLLCTDQAIFGPILSLPACGFFICKSGLPGAGRI